MDAAIPADAQNAPTGIWKSRTEREIPTAPTPIIVVVNERKNNGDSNSVAKPSTESDQAHARQILVLRAVAVSGTLPPRLTTREALRAVGRLGGHLRQNGEPGWLVLGRGMQKLLRMEAGWAAAEQARECDQS